MTFTCGRSGGGVGRSWVKEAGDEEGVDRSTFLDHRVGKRCVDARRGRA